MLWDLDRRPDARPSASDAGRAAPEGREGAEREPGEASPVDRLGRSQPDDAGPAAPSHVDGVAVDDMTRSASWAQIEDRVNRIANLLRGGFEIEPGQRIAVVMGNRVELIEIVLGSMVAGAVVTLVNWHLTPAEVSYVLGDSSAKVVFCDPEREAFTRACADGRRVVMVGRPFDEALDRCSNEELPGDSAAGGTMFYTSGTTGRPKGVRRGIRPTVDEQLRAIRDAGKALGLDGTGPHLVTGPLHHAAPLGFALMDLLNGAPLVIMSRWDERQALTLIEQRSIRHTHMVPTMFVRLLALPDPEREAARVSSLTLVLHGAAPISDSVKRRMIQWWGPVLVEYWGASEGGVVTLADSGEWLSHPGTVGRPTPSHEVYVTGPDGAALPPGEIGELWCKNLITDDVFEYHGDPDRTAAAFKEPGTYTIGDLGCIDHDGYVYLADRASNMIISGGVNIYPAEIEHVLDEHPAVADCAVFGIPDDDWGESPKAAVRLNEGFLPSSETEEAILAFGREHLARYKVPRSIDFETELPRQPNGKIYTRLLRDRYWQGRDSQI